MSCHDLNEDLAAEQKARVCYDNLLRQMDDPDVCDTLRFLRERELVHYQRFGDALRISQDRMDSSNFYGWNPNSTEDAAKGNADSRGMRNHLPQVRNQLTETARRGCFSVIRCGVCI